MSIQAETLLNHGFPELRQSYAERDAILYALGVGLGADPLDERDLDYLVETRLKVLPTFAATLASPGMWIRDPQFGVDFKKLVVSQQEAEFHAPLPPAANVKATPRVASLYDRGEGKGALLTVERAVRDVDSDVHYATVRQTLLLRGDGGFGGTPAPKVEAVTMPNRAPDAKEVVRISPRAALIYRLSGDLNPLHAEPSFAKAAGFSQPILHGLASYAIAGNAIMRATGGSIARLACRFAGVVLPGSEMTVSIWREGSGLLFEAHVGEQRVLDQGRAN